MKHIGYILLGLWILSLITLTSPVLLVCYIHDIGMISVKEDKIILAPWN